MNSKKRNPWAGAVLNWLAPGCAYLYVGRLHAAIVFWCVVQALAWFPPAWTFGVRPSSTSLVLPLMVVPYALVAAVIGVGWWVARSTVQPYTLTRLNGAMPYLMFIGASMGGAWANSAWISSKLEAFHITSGSMEPALTMGDVLFVDKRGSTVRAVRHGDLVVTASPDTPGLTILKRVLGLAGDTVEMRADSLFRNGRYVQEDYIIATRVEPDADPRMAAWQRAHLVTDQPRYEPTTATWGPLAIPEGGVLLLGDNRGMSYDTRYFGWGSHGAIVGQPAVTYWSYSTRSRRFLPVFTAPRWGRLGRPWEANSDSA